MMETQLLEYRKTTRFLTHGPSGDEITSAGVFWAMFSRLFLSLVLPSLTGDRESVLFFCFCEATHINCYGTGSMSATQFKTHPFDTTLKYRRSRFSSVSASLPSSDSRSASVVSVVSHQLTFFSLISCKRVSTASILRQSRAHIFL